jgi:hypothetical protein
VNNSGCWFTDGHGDYIRHFMLALGAVPEWAPAGQNHITGSTTVIKSVTYAADSNSIAYTTFDGASTETLRIAFTPAAVMVNSVFLPERGDLTQPGWVFNASNGVLRIRHDTGTNVRIVNGQLITLASVSVHGDSFCFSWNSQPGTRYVVQGKASLTDAGWAYVSDTITATNVVTSYCELLPSPYKFFRVAADVALN